MIFIFLCPIYFTRCNIPPPVFTRDPVFLHSSRFGSVQVSAASATPPASPADAATSGDRAESAQRGSVSIESLRNNLEITVGRMVL